MSGDALPHGDPIGEAIRLFNEEYFFEAHEHLEGIWKEERGPSREFLQGLIQVCAALHHFQNGNLVGAADLLGRGAAKMRKYPSPYLGIDSAALLARVDGLRVRVEGMRDGREPRAPIEFPRI